MAALNRNNVRKVYLLTYSKADSERFDSKFFAKAAARAFEAVATTFIVQWACCMEQHKDEGVHFHMCVLLNKIQRWSLVKRYLQKVENVVVHLSGHAGYHTAFQYVTKEDTEILRSENHLSSVAAPETLPSVRKCTAKAPSRKNARAAMKRLTNMEVSSIITSNGIDSRSRLLAKKVYFIRFWDQKTKVCNRKDHEKMESAASSAPQMSFGKLYKANQ